MHTGQRLFGCRVQILVERKRRKQEIQKMQKTQRKKLSLLIILGVSLANLANADSYNNYMPTPSDSPLYYSIGGGSVVPAPPSMTDQLHADVGVNGLGFNCGLFNKNASITNTMNGLKNSAMDMFNNAINSAKGAVIEMPAYLISKANPSLYQILQNGLSAGTGDFNAGMKSCDDMQSDIDSGNNPYNNAFHASMHNKWVNFQYGSDTFQGVQGMSYGSAEKSDVTQAKTKVNKDNGANGIVWTHGDESKGDKYAGGENQPKIQLVYDVTVAGVNALISNSDYYNKGVIPKSSNLSDAWQTIDEVGKWAVNVLGESIISTYKGGSSTVAGQGLLPKVQKTYTDIFQKMSDLISHKTETSMENLQAISANRLMINAQIIRDLSSDDAITRSIETSALAQGVSALRVITKAQDLINIYQAARQVPSISSSDVAQKGINQWIKMLQAQIQQIISNNDNNKKLLTSTISVMMQTKANYIARNNAVKAAGYDIKPVVNGVLSSS